VVTASLHPCTYSNSPMRRGSTYTAAIGPSSPLSLHDALPIFNNNRTTGGAAVLMSKVGGGTLSSVTDNGNGTYTATLTSPTTTGSGTATATSAVTPVATSPGASSSVVNFAPGPADGAHSTMSP